jgi:Domain of unknown function (DUF6438)
MVALRSVLALALLGCRGAGPAEGAPQPIGASASAPAPAPAAAPAPAPASASASAPVPPDLVVTLDRGACEKRCAVYRLTVSASGAVTYEGRYYVRVTGTQHETIDRAKVASLWRSIQSARFFELADQYGYDSTDGCRSVLTDAPVATLTVSFGGTSKRVIHHHRCVDAIPERLTELEDEVDAAVRAVQWIASRP